MTTQDFVEELDTILSGAPEEGGIYTHKVNKVSFEILGDRLGKDGYGKWLGGYEFQVNLRGVDYIKTGGYTGLYSAMMVSRRNKQSKLKLPRKQINALKREPYLIAWGIIATLIAIMLALVK
jgi:hypothetical protein